MDNWPEEGFREVGKLYLEALGTQNYNVNKKANEVRVAQPQEIV
jgi:hypothetical protein